MRTLEMTMQPDPPEPLCSGWIYAFGLYRPRWQMERHLNSDWSQAVILAKHKAGSAIDGFGRIIARHLKTLLMEDEEYVITHVPAEEDHAMYLFLDFARCATEALADAIYSYMKDQANVLLATLLMQAKPKPRKQHQCSTDAERAENVRGVYAATHSALMAGKCVILVDDVLTSGATMRECAAVLRSAGAKSVMGIALARTDRAKTPAFVSGQDWPGGDAA
jgi:predicted amidophosphoribosyltransferase